MDPVLKLWMFYNWIGDQRDDSDLAKNHAYLVGSFINPEAVRKIIDDSNSFASTDEEFEQSIELMKEINNKKEKAANPQSTKRKRRKILG